MKRSLWVLAVASLSLSTVAMGASKWVPYHNDSLGFALKVPSDWLLKVTQKAAGFTGPGEGDSRPAVGILRSTVQDYTIDQAAEKEFKQKHKPSNWKQIPSTVGGSRAIKIMTGDESKKILEFYVESGSGYYLIQCIAPAQSWSQYNDIFATMLRTFHFITAVQQ